MNARAVLDPHFDTTSPTGENPFFELAPVALWLEDWSGVRELLNSWRLESGAAVREMLLADPERARACASQMRVIRVNPKALELYEASNLEHLTSNLHRIFRDDFLAALPRELGEVWDRGACAETGVNYSLSGRRLDIIVNCRSLSPRADDWSRVLVSMEDITALENARRREASNQRYAQGLFEHSPVSLWVQDFSGIHFLFEGLRTQGIEDFRVFTEVHPEFVARCMREIRIIDVNQRTVGLFAARDKDDLLQRLDQVFRGEMAVSFRETLIDLWKGKLLQEREVVNYALDGSPLYLHLQFSVFPGREDDWSLVQVALTDITARKKAEAYLEFLGQHDSLTKLKNRNCFVDELARMSRARPHAASIVAIDVNGLKEVNDAFGHAAGDNLLRRVGEVLGKAARKPHLACRIGGDEFVILMPGAQAAEAEAMVANLGELLHLNNQFYSSRALSFSIGRATLRAGETIEDTMRRADQRMYEEKKARRRDPR